MPPRYHTAYFSHIWPGGYGAGYHACSWTQVLGADATAWFAEQGGMTPLCQRDVRHRPA